jgi:hypothetical protein
MASCFKWSNIDFGRCITRRWSYYYWYIIKSFNRREQSLFSVLRYNFIICCIITFLHANWFYRRLVFKEQTLGEEQTLRTDCGNIEWASGNVVSKGAYRDQPACLFAVEGCEARCLLRPAGSGRRRRLPFLRAASAALPRAGSGLRLCNAAARTCPG